MRICTSSRALTALAALLATSGASALTVTTEPAQLVAYQPFDVVVQYSREYCIARASPIVAQATTESSLAGSKTVTIVLSHLDVTDPVVCTPRSSSRVRVLGLPPGMTTLQVGITQTIWAAVLVYRSAVAESGEATLSVPTSSNTPVKVMTINGPNGAPFYLSTVDAQNLSGSGSLLPSSGAESNPSFYGWSALRSPVPSAAQRLYSLKYASPSRFFYTTSVAERDALLRVGFVEQVAPSWGPIYVLAATNGACPLGSTPVRRLFNQADFLHRYEMNVDTISMLAANGYVDENIAFCSPAQ